MERVERYSQAYSQAPWRKQVQLLGLFLLIVVFMALVAGIYLNVSARSGAIGREIQFLQEQTLQNEQKIADLRAQLGTMYSSSEMERRARIQGFQLLDPEEALYVVVPGYGGRQPLILAPAYQREVVSASVLPAEYTEPLSIWLRKQFNHYIFPLFKVQP
jgi:cell division protein FtsL